jgi:hypothetical protein
MIRLARWLAARRKHRDPATAALRRARLRDAGRRRLVGGPRAICLYHDELLFLTAFPCDVAELRAAEGELHRIAALLAQRGPLRDSKELQGSGIAGTPLTYAFSLDLVRWLHDAARGSAALSWDGDSLGPQFDEFLALLATPAQADGLLDPHTTTRAWLKLVDRSAGGLAWLLRRTSELNCPPALLDRVFEALDLQVRWCVPPRFSRTLNRFPQRAPAFAAATPRRVDLRTELARDLPAPARLSASGRRELLDAARATLAARSRETDPVTYASAEEITLLRLEDGIDVLLLGMTPARRQPVESYFGFVAAMNRVPVAYGGGWVFFERCEIGVNLFEEFRGGQSALIFASVLRAYRQHYRVRQFLVDPFQFGADNEEAIASGAYWFYHRLGFRSTDARLAALAEREARANAANASRRTTPRTLRRLATAKLFLDVSPAAKSRRYARVAPDLIELSLELTRRGEEWGGASGLRRLGLSHADRAGVTRALALKSGPRERDYCLALQGCVRFRDALMPRA